MSAETAVEIAYRPRLKLFLSADMVGSTALKQNFKQDLADVVWPEIIQGFYRNFIEQVEIRWFAGRADFEDRNNLLETEKFFGPVPKFWKTVGDEVLFWKELTDETQIWATLAIWLSAVSSIRKFFSNFTEQEVRNLDIKSAGWIAGFPVRNRMFRSSAPSVEDFSEFVSVLYQGDEVDTGQSYDFVGPSIDIGFRLSSQSSQRKMCIDAATAYILAKSSGRIHDHHSEELAELLEDDIGLKGVDLRRRLQVFYSGSEALKGVGGERKYPKFWINTCRHGTSEALREELMFPQGRQPAEPQRIIDFCETFYAERSENLSRPFIDSIDALTFLNKPKEYDGELSNMKMQILEKIQKGESLAF